jgi:hypothetical protein
MSHLRKQRPSPALGVATLALFVALGGTVWAAARIDGHSIKPKSLPGNRVIVGSLPPNRLAPGAIGGDRVAASTLGQVPSAVHADSADVARSAGDAVHAQGAEDARTVNGFAAGCGEGLRLFAGACWETHVQPAALNADQAALACAHAGGELPRVLALKAFGEQSGVALEARGEWSGDIFSVIPEEFDVLTVSSSGEITFASHKDALPFRCVIPVLH